MATIDPTIRFGDIAQREADAIRQLNYDLRRFEDIEKKQQRTLSEVDTIERDRIVAILAELKASQNSKNKPTEVCDPLFVAARTMLNEQGGLALHLRSHDDGTLLFDGVNSLGALRKAVDAGGLVWGDIALTALTTGLLITDEVEAPPIAVVPQQGNFIGVPATTNPLGRTLYPDVNHPRFASFTKAFFAALGEARSFGELAGRVLSLLSEEGDVDGAGGNAASVNAGEFARHAWAQGQQGAI